MSYDYKEELEKAKAYRNSQKLSGTVSKRSGGKAPKNKTKRRILITIVAELFTLVAIFGYAYFQKTYNRGQKLEFHQDVIQNQELTAEDLKKMKGYWMIAIFGVDSRGSNVGAGTNADVNMICCINQDTGDIKLVSVFRDSYLNIDDKDTYNKINAAYFAGGPSQAVAALNKNLDLNITDYITFNWKAVADAINILGGVDVDLSKAEFRYINSFITETVNSTGVGSKQLTQAGPNHLNGVQAVAYGRLRLMDNDYARTERQRKIIQLAFEKAKKADYSVLNNVLVVVLEQVSHSFDFADLTNMALNISKYELGETTGFPMQRGEANMGRKGACVIPATLESNVTLLHQFLFGDEVYTTTDTVKKISAKIASDTGIYKEGQVIGHVSTEGYLPKETEPATTEETLEESSSEIEETDEFGNLIIKPSDPTESSPFYPGIGETDEFGNLVDGPEDIDPTDSGPGVRPTNPSFGENGPINEVGTSESSDETRVPGSLEEESSEEESSGSETRPTQVGPPPISEESSEASRPGGESSSVVPTVPNVPSSAVVPSGGPGEQPTKNGPGE